MEEIEKYNRAKQFAIDFFARNKQIKSLALGNVYLNSDGFMHLIFQNKKHRRDTKNQIKRFYLLRYIKTVLESMKYYQEYFERLENVEIRHQNKTDFVYKKVIYWGFIAVIDNKIRIKIILKKVSDRQIIFWSIIPYWKTEHYKDIKFISLHKGNPAED